MIPMDETSPPASDEERMGKSREGSPQLGAAFGSASADALGDGMPSLRRNLHPESSKQVLQTWLEENLDHPYPLEDKKLEFMKQTRLTMKQINYWFINARRRKVRSMREQLYYRQAAAARASGDYHSDDLHLNSRFRFKDRTETTETSLVASTGFQPSYSMPRPQATTLPSPTTLAHIPTSYPAVMTGSGAGPLTQTNSVQVLRRHHPYMPISNTPMQQQPQEQHHQLHQQQQSPLRGTGFPVQQQMQPMGVTHHDSFQQPANTLWTSQPTTTSLVSPTTATIGEWTQARRVSPPCPSPPKTLTVSQVGSSSGLVSPQAAVRPLLAATDSITAPVSPMATLDATSPALALSVRMPVILQAHVHPLQHQAPTPTAAVPVALQASTYMPWPVRVAPQVTLAPSYPTGNHLLYTPVSTVSSTTIPSTTNSFH